MRYLLPVLLVAVPLISYVVWYRLARDAARRRREGTLPQWRDAPWSWIAIATLAVLVAATLGLAAIDRNTLGVYVPARFEDGQVVPGRVGD